jgi:RHS repeat-associated protein
MTTLEGVNAYGYDNRNWLTYAAYPDPAGGGAGGHIQAFEYDPLGNRTILTQVSGFTSQVSYSYGPANRLLSSTSPAETNQYFYDGAGRLTNQLVNGQARHYAYNFRGQMTALHDMDGRVFSYAFDGTGNRLSQSLNDCLTTRFVYDGPNVVLDLNASNEFVHAYVSGPGIDQPVERIGFISGQTRLRHVYHADALGSIAAMTDESGQTAKTYAYEAFGTIRAEDGDLVKNRTTYTGREELGDSTGFRFYRYRVYDPSTGRFVSEDPLRFLTGPNVYIYCANNPGAQPRPSTASFLSPIRSNPPMPTSAAMSILLTGQVKTLARSRETSTLVAL